MLFKIITGAVFIAIMFAFSRMVAKPAAETGWLAVLAIVVICFAIALWIDRRDKRKRQEAERQAALRDEAARLHEEITDSLSGRPRRDVIDAEYTALPPRR